MRSKRLLAFMIVTAFAGLAGHTVRVEAEDATKPETISVFGEAELEVPSDFKRVEPKSRIIEHEFEAKAGEGDDLETAHVTMMAAGGDVPANIKRWKGQFTGGDPDQQKSKEMTIGKWNVHIVDVSGSFAERVGGGPFAGGKVVNRENYAMTGAILVHPEGRKFFVKMIGPEAVVTANREPFVEMIKSVGE